MRTELKSEIWFQDSSFFFVMVFIKSNYYYSLKVGLRPSFTHTHNCEKYRDTRTKSCLRKETHRQKDVYIRRHTDTKVSTFKMSV